MKPVAIVLYDIMFVMGYPIKKLLGGRYTGNRWTILLCSVYCILSGFHLLGFKEVKTARALMTIMIPAVIIISGVRLFCFAKSMFMRDGVNGKELGICKARYLLLSIVAFAVLYFTLPSELTKFIMPVSIIIFAVCLAFALIQALRGEVSAKRKYADLRERGWDDPVSYNRENDKETGTYGTYNSGRPCVAQNFGGGNTYDYSRNYSGNSGSAPEQVQRPQGTAETQGAPIYEDVAKELIYNQLFNCKSLDELKKIRNSLTKSYHPDTKDGSEALTSYINLTFDEMKKKLENES